MKKSNLLTTAAAVMLLTAAPAAAQTCIKTPSCADLGYTKTAADCSGKTILKCPLDNTQVYCPGYEETLRTYKVGDTYVDCDCSPCRDACPLEGQPCSLEAADEAR